VTEFRPLEPLQVDALAEVANIGAGHAATALSEMTHRPVAVTIPRVSLVRLEQAAECVGLPAETFVAILLPIGGDVTGRALLLFDRASARSLCRILLGYASDASAPFTAVERSALKELGNILTSAYTTALGSFTGLALLPSVPDLVVDRLEAVLASFLVDRGRRADHVLCVETQFHFREEDQRLSGTFILMPDADALRTIFRAIRLEP
jgi:chemotaxis protein CheC